MEKITRKREMEDAEQVEARRSSFFSGLRRKFLSLATAGLLTFGAAAEKSFADQIRVEKKPKGGVELTLEPVLSEKTLADFEARLETEEPEFVAWLQNYEAGLVRELDVYENYLLHPDADRDKEKELSLRNSVSEQVGEIKDEKVKKEVLQMLERAVAFNLKARGFLDANQEAVEKVHGVLKKNIHQILLSVAFLDDSKNVREAQVRLSRPPRITFELHDVGELGAMGGYTRYFGESYVIDPASEPLPQPDPQISILGLAFALENSGVGLENYPTVLIHEFTHAFRFTPTAKDFISQRILRGFLEEGVTQNSTLEVTQFLARTEPILAPRVGFAYDTRVVIASILRGIATTAPGDNILSQFTGGIVSYDAFLDAARKRVSDLGLSGEISSDLEDVEWLGSSVGQEAYAGSFLVKLLARLRLDGLTLPPEFVKNILAQGRALDIKAGKRLDEEAKQIVTAASLREESMRAAKKVFEDMQRVRFGKKD